MQEGALLLPKAWSAEELSSVQLENRNNRGLIPTTQWPTAKSTIPEAMGKPTPLLGMYNQMPVPGQISNLKAYFWSVKYTRASTANVENGQVEDASVLHISTEGTIPTMQFYGK